MRPSFPAVFLAIGLAAPAITQPRPMPGSPNAAAVVAGTYAADPHHTQVAWTINHLGFNVYHGLFGDATGTLTIDPANPAAARVEVTFPIAKVVTTSDALNKHLMAADILDATKYPTGTFTSTKVVVNGTNATIDGTLTLHGVAKPVTLAAKFTGVGVNPINKATTIGFEATTSIKRSDFGITYLLPALGDRVDLQITAAFEKK